MKKKKILVSFLVFMLLLGGCSKTDTPKSQTTDIQNPPEVESEDRKEDTSPSDQEEENEEEKQKEEANQKESIFTEIVPNSVLHVNWKAEDGEFMSGTSSCVKTDFSEEPILITAFHYFMPDNGSTFTGSDLLEYIKGGEIFDAVSEEPTGVSIKEVIEIKDAAPVPDVNHDLAAFYVDKPDSLVPFTFADTEPKAGDTIYLLASLWDTDTPNENCIYECEVLTVQDGNIYYQLDEKYGTTGASGAPIVNGEGELVGIHIGSASGGMRVAHGAADILEQLKAALGK